MSVTARVVVTLELTGLGSWGDNCPLGQVYKQAAEVAVGRIRRAVNGDATLLDAKIIGQPVVTAVMSTEEGK